ncbi:hypothetical protein AB1L07_02230 [Niallia alba]|uniref:hypothetical protein n=1 Tax=Niallia alba TaxID=2729105 RepID=UPI002E202F19|nr:hypothetical protein [Niallia alba]
MGKLFQCYADSDYFLDLNEILRADSIEEARNQFEQILIRLNLKYGEIHVWELEIALL